MHISQIFSRPPPPAKFEAREFPTNVVACPPLISFPGVIAGTSTIWEEVEDLAQPVQVPKGEVIYPDPGKIPPFIYVKSGKLCLNFINDDGDELILHFIFPGGTTYDGIYCANGQINTMPLKALEDCSLLLFDSRLTFTNLMEINPLLARNLLYSQAVKNLVYSGLALINSYKAPLAKVALLLYEMYQTRRRKTFPGLITQSEMGRLLQLHRVTVANAIARIKAEGMLISFTRREVVLANPEYLPNLALASCQKK